MESSVGVPQPTQTESQQTVTAESPEVDAQGNESPYARVEWLEPLVNKGLNDRYDQDKTPETERQRIELWVLKGSELLKASAEDFFGKLKDTEVATYFGGIGMGIAGNDSEYKVPEGKGGDARVAVGDEW